MACSITILREPRGGGGGEESETPCYNNLSIHLSFSLYILLVLTFYIHMYIITPKTEIPTWPPITEVAIVVLLLCVLMA